MTFPEFIRSHRADVVRKWTLFAKTIESRGVPHSDLVLADHIDQVIEAIALELESAVPAATDAVAIRSISPSGLASLDTAVRIHTSERMESGYQLSQIIHEYRALHAILVRLWHDYADLTDPASFDLLELLNDTIDQIIQDSVAFHAAEVERSRELLLGALGHDLRNPLNSISMQAHLLARMPIPKEAQDVLAPMLRASIRMGQLIGDLLDITRIRLGSGLDLHRVSADMGALCARSIEEVQSASSTDLIRVHSHGDLCGCWDTTRIYQSLTNLLGNAIQHGKPNAPITVTLTGDDSTVTCAVQNWGATIAPEMLGRIFEPMRRVQAERHFQARNTDSIGLGLYIAKEIVVAHGGTLGVTSTEAEGTVFTISLNRNLGCTAPSLVSDADLPETLHEVGTLPPVAGHTAAIPPSSLSVLLRA